MHRTGKTTWIAYAAMCLIWGTTWLAIKVGLHGIPPLSGVGLRFLIAGVFLYAVVAVRGEREPLRALPWNVIGVLAVMLFGLNYSLIYLAAGHLDSGVVAVLFGTVSLWTFAFARLFYGVRTSLRTYGGAVCAMGGIALLSLSGALGGSTLYGFLVVVATASAAFANVYTKHNGAHPPLLTLPPAMGISGACVLVLGLFVEGAQWTYALNGVAIAALLYLAIFGSGIAFMLFMWLLQRLSAGVTAMSSLTFPVIALAFGVALGGEHVTARELIGAALVVIGLGIALAPERRRAADHSRAAAAATT